MNKPSRVAAAILVFAATFLGASVPAATAAAAAPAVSVTLSTSNSGVLDGSAPLRALVTIDNPTANATPTATATLSVDTVPLSSRSALADWFSGESKNTATTQVVGTSAVPTVASKLSGAVDVDAPASSLGFGATGIYAVSVEVTSGSTVLGTARTAVAWNPTGIRPVPVALAVPITVPAEVSEFLTAAELTEYTGPGGILTRELADVQDNRIAIGIDPRIIASIRILGKSVPASAKAWLDALQALPNESFPLSWADSDITAPLRAGASAVLEPKSLAYAIDPSQFPAVQNSTPSPTPASGTGSAVPTSAALVAWKYTMPSLQWPAANSVVPADLDKLNTAGISGAILTSRNVDDPDGHGLGGASGKSGSTSIAVSDDDMSGYLADAIQATTRLGATVALTELTTTLALIGQKSAGQPRTVLLTMGRNWASTATDFTRDINDLYAQPWVSQGDLTSVFTETPNKLTIDKDDESTGRVALVAQLLAAEAQVDAFSVIAANPAAITSSYRLQLLSLLSNEWLDTPAAWTKAATKWLKQTTDVVTSVQVSHSGSALALADQVALPITITNGLDQEVSVTLLVRSTTTQVSIDPQYQSQTVTIDAGSQKKVSIPIEALSNGNAHLVVALRSATGLPIGRTVALNVNVQAGWETVGTLVFVALIVALFAFGIIRRFRKRRTEDDEDAPPTDSGSND